MNRYTSKINGLNRLAFIMDGICFFSVMAVLYILLSMGLEVEYTISELLIIWGIALALGLLYGLVRSLFKRIAIGRQIRRQDAGIDFNDENFERVAKNLYLGRDWLVYKNDTSYRIFNHSSIRMMDVQTKRFSLFVRILGPKGTEGFTIRKPQEGLKERLLSWAKQNSF